MSARDAMIALRRFGLGPRPGEARAVARDPRGYLLASLDKSGTLVIDAPLVSSDEAARKLFELQRQRDEERKQTPAGSPPAGKVRKPRGTVGGKDTSMEGPPAMEGPTAPILALIRQYVVKEVSARISHAVRADAGFLERLVLFWSNHFCVSIRKSPVLRATVGAYEREAIRPHVLGRFVDMVKASATHPAMLNYLDNARSVGPGSQIGLRRRAGLNENYARELLELHTLGVNGDYTQADVTSLARILTGWSVAGSRHPDQGKFLFVPQMHEPGPQTVVGRTYRGGGIEQGMAVLDDLARHPSTSTYIATRLARHFVTDTPPQRLVEQLARTFRETEGDLKAMARALVLADDAWMLPPRKILPPFDLLVAAYRGLLLSPPDGFALRTLHVLGQPMWDVPSPKGWPDEDEHWAAPKAIMERIDWAETLVKQFGGVREVTYLAEDIYAGTLSATTRDAIARAPNVADGLIMFLMSPEFQRR